MLTLLLLATLSAAPAKPAPGGTLCVEKLAGALRLGKELLEPGQESRAHELAPGEAGKHLFSLDIDGVVTELRGDQGAQLQVAPRADGPHKLVLKVDGKPFQTVRFRFPEGDGLRMLPATYGQGIGLDPMQHRRCRWAERPDGG